GGRAFFAQQEIFDVVNLCQFLDDIDDEAALIGVLRSPFFSLSDDAVFALGSHPARALHVPRPPGENVALSIRQRSAFPPPLRGEGRGGGGDPVDARPPTPTLPHVRPPS